MYPAARTAFLKGDLNWENDTIKVVLLDSGYAYASGHTSLVDIPSGARRSVTAALTGKTVSNAVLDADDTLWPLVASGTTCTSFVVYRDTGSEATSTLILFFDDAASLPANPNGGNISLAWPSGADRIYNWTA